MQYPKISIVTPTLNSQKYLEECIRSVTEQQYPNLEYIIVDGGSTDDTLSIIDRYRSAFHIVITEKDNGAAEAINKGFAASTGDIMYWLNSDDKLHSGALFAVAEIFQTFPDVDWIMGLPTWISQSGTAYSEMSYGYKKFYQSPKYINDSMHLKFARWSKWRFAMGDFSAIQQESVFFRRELWRKAGGYIMEGIIAYDLELWTRFFIHSKVYTLEVILAGFRVHRNQISAQQRDRYRAESEGIIHEFIKKIDADSVKNKFRTKLAKSFRLFYYYQVPVLQSIFVSLLNLPPCISYSLQTEKFHLKAQ